MKKNAFTMVEIVLTMMIISFLIVFMIRSFKSMDFSDKQQVATALKVIQDFDGATSKVLGLEQQNFPLGVFISNAANPAQWEFVSYVGSSPATAQNIIDIYGKYVKFAKTGYQFCKVSKCENLDDLYSASSATDKIPAVRWFSKTYIGITKDEVMEKCPDYYYPGNEGIITAKDKTCWGKLFIDTNGTEGPNEPGKDIYVFGLGESGIEK